MLSQLPTEVPVRRSDPVIAFESRLLPILVRLREQPWVLAAMTAPEPPATVFRAAGPGELWVPLVVMRQRILLLFRWTPGGPERDVVVTLAADSARAIAAQVNAEERAKNASLRASRAERRWAKEHVEREAAQAEVERVRGREHDARARLAAAEERAVAHNPLRSVSGLLAGLAHDIRSPLTSILCNLQVMEETRAEDEELAPMVADARLACERIGVLVGGVRLLAEGTHVSGPIDVADCVHAALRLCRLHGSRLSVTVESGVEAGLFAQGNAADLVHAVYQLVTNAVDASSRGATVTVRARRGSSEIVIEVADAGAGVPEAERPHLFVPFRSMKPGALGASLAGARAQLAKNGGDLVLGQTEPGTAGARFEIRLPAHRDGERPHFG